MDYLTQKQVLILLFFIFTGSSSPVFGYNVFKYSVEKPELNSHIKEGQLSRQKKNTALFYVARQMQSRPNSDLAQFAKVSLNEMAYLYEEEAIRAINERPLDRKRISKLYRWSYSTIEYARHLHAIAESINVGTIVELYYGGLGDLIFTVYGLPYIINSPLIRDPGELEKRIIDRFCNYNNCDLEFPELQLEPKKINIVIEAGWHINDKSHPEYVTRDGLHFIFSDIKNRSHKQEVCLNIIKELKLIAGVLRETYDKGVFVDWDNLNIESSVDGSYDRLVINSSGDSIIIDFIELAKMPDLAALTSPWIKAQVENMPYKQYLYGDDLFASEIH